MILHRRQPLDRLYGTVSWQGMRPALVELWWVIHSILPRYGYRHNDPASQQQQQLLRIMQVLLLLQQQQRLLLKLPEMLHRILISRPTTTT